MPSLRMKRSSLFCVNENKCLLVSHISSTISEKSHLKISHIAAEEGTICQDCHEVSPSTESNIQDWESTGANELLSVEDIHIKQLPRSSNDSEVIKEVELPQVTCSANFGTIFLPTLRYIDGYDVPHSWNNSDFYTSDMVLAGSPYDGNFICNDLAKALIFPERDTAESSIFFDVTEGHMSLPFLDYIVESSEMVVVRPSDEARMDYDNSNLSFAIRQICPGDQEADLRRCVESDEAQYFDPHSFIRNLPDLSDVLPNGRPTILPKESREEKPITLVLDLDETLVHSTLERCDDADFTFTVFFNMKEHSVYVKERPHLRTFLKKVEEMFQIVVFTASQSIYAEQLLDILDPDGKLISGRAYRESCIFSDGNYTKDLTVLGLDLAKVMIIDNSPQVFRLQVNNGIPIKSWFDDPSDNELISLIPFLETLANADDVRPLIAKRFGNKE